MAWLKIKGVKRVTSKRHVYHYHRATGRRIAASPEADPAGFAAEVERLDAEALARTPVAQAARAGSLGGLITAYKLSPEWQALKPDTQKSYNRVFDALAELDDMPLVDIDQPFVLATRDRIATSPAKKKSRLGNGGRRWLASQTVAVLSIIFGWGLPRGIVSSNPAMGVPKIRRPRSQGVANKAWTAAEIDALLKAAQDRGHVGLRKGIALAYYGGLRKKDVVEWPRSARSGDAIRHEQSKNGVTTTIFEAKRMGAILDEKDEVAGKTLVVNRAGDPYTRDGFDSVFDSVKQALADAGTIRTGLTFHGLRKSLGKRAADRGFSENDIAAAMGMSNPASARPYTIEAAREHGSKRVFNALDGGRKRRRNKNET